MSEKRTCLYERHIALNARMVPFGGFEMPIQYTDIIDEHTAVRTKCGVFDVSHMGEVLVTGEQAEEFVQYIFTNDIAGAPVGKVFYGMMLHENGGTVEDLLVYNVLKSYYPFSDSLNSSILIGSFLKATPLSAKRLQKAVILGTPNCTFSIEATSWKTSHGLPLLTKRPFSIT